MMFGKEVKQTTEVNEKNWPEDGDIKERKECAEHGNDKSKRTTEPERFFRKSANERTEIFIE